MGQPAEQQRPGAAPGWTSDCVPPRLVAYAILKANWNQGRSYLDNFVPFVAECLRTLQAPVQPVQLQRAVRDEFGLRIPLGPLTAIVRRAASEGLVELSDNCFFPDHDHLAARALGVERNAVVRRYDAIVQRLVDFSQSRYGKELPHLAASSGLDAYANEFGAHILTTGALANVEFRPEVVTAQDTMYVVHAFVEHLSETDPALFEAFQAVVEGSMLASVVYLPDVGAVQQRFRDTTAYLDTAFLLRVLGHLGPELQAPAEELLELLREYGARVACFERTVVELRGVIESSVPGTPSNGGWQGDVAAYFQQRGLQRSDVLLIAAGLERSLEQLRVRVLPAPAHTLELGVDERALEAELAEGVRYRNPRALVHDLDALTAVHRHRLGRYQPILEDCRAIFVTTNRSLVRVARTFFGFDDQFSWPLAIVDSDLATLMWLKKPLRYPDLPRKRIVADCYAALHPDPAMWGRWLDQVERTATAGDYSDEQLSVMRFSPDAQRALMDETYGDEAAVTAETVDKVLAAAEAKITAPVRTELDEERRRRRTLEAEAAADKAARVSAEAQAANEAAARAAVEAMAQHQETLRDQRLERLHRRAGNNAAAVTKVLYVVGALLIACGITLAALGLAIPGSHLPVPLRVVLWLLLVVVVGASAAGAINGGNLKNLMTRFQSWLTANRYRAALRRIGEEALLESHG